MIRLDLDQAGILQIDHGVTDLIESMLLVHLSAQDQKHQTGLFLLQKRVIQCKQEKLPALDVLIFTSLKLMILLGKLTTYQNFKIKRKRKCLENTADFKHKIMLTSTLQSMELRLALK